MSDKLPKLFRPPRDIEVFPGLEERIDALTPEDMLDTSIEDAEAAKGAKFAEELRKAEQFRRQAADNQ